MKQGSCQASPSRLPAAPKLTPKHFAALLACLFAAAAVHAAPHPPSFLGAWQLDDARTAAAQPVEAHRRSVFEGFGMPSVSVNGIPLPRAGSADAPAVSSGSAPDPDVLRCARMTIEAVGKDLQLTYVGVGSETLTSGRVQGVRTRWKDNFLQTAYETTSRKVSIGYELQPDDTLMVTVKLDPVDGAAVTHKRVFRRDDGAAFNPE